MSSSKVWKYDVFLSFRGEDTRRSFVSHLFNALEQRGIQTFKDDERLESGKPISSELLKAIEESKFAIVVFSKSYASSRWCLEELAHIIKCLIELKQITVIPIFYDVSPSDVRHQKSLFADSFSQHEEIFKDDTEMIQRWRDAFNQAGKLSGYHLQNYKDEADCIKKVVDYILPKSIQVISPFSESLVGMKYQTEDVISLLDMESNDVRSVGIWGMGGIGKTEIATSIYERYRHNFEADCFLGDVGEKYQKRGLTWLQQALICKLLGKEMTITSEREGAVVLKNGLHQKKVLVILDDVNHQDQLKYLVGGPEWFGRDSRILITTRDKRLIINHVEEDKVYEVKLLSGDKALELFCIHAFNKKSPETDFDELSSEVVKYADGLPLALKVLGSSFYGRNKDQWKDIIERLKKIPNDDIQGKLKISLDGLNEDEMRIFLDIACFYYDIARDYVETLLKSCGIHSIGISNLIERSLLSISGGYITMHNLIRQMGEDVLREECPNSRIWRHEEVRDLFAGKLKTMEVESLSIPKYYRFECNAAKLNQVFQRMHNLQVLLIGEKISCSNRTISCLPSNLGWIEWLYCFRDSTITCLPSSLRWIEWNYYPSRSLPKRLEPSLLVGLCLRNSRRLVELWPISKNMGELKVLDLQNSHALKKTPNFRDMPNLVTLILRSCWNLEKVHPSLGHCRMLTCLDLYGCRKLKKLPEFVSMESLETLNLQQCTSLRDFPKITGDMPHLSTLCVGSPWIRSLDLSLTNLSYLILEDCGVLESIPDSFQDLKSLEYLYISGCENLMKLPNSIQMESLEQLYICDCPKLENFPEINGDMHRLSEMMLRSTGIRELPLSIGNLSGLTYLSLKDCESLVSLPNSYLMNLKRLVLRGCKNLEKLPENIGDLQQLAKLDARETAISQPPLSITKLRKLKQLKFSQVQLQHSLSFILHQVSGLSSLTELDLSNCSIPCGLPEDLGSLQSLWYLNVRGSNISCLPKSINQLLCLQHLDVQFCRNLNELPGELPPNLEVVYADYYLAMKSMRDLLIKCLKLRRISISWHGLEKTEHEPVSTYQVNMLKFLQCFLRTSIQCDFHQRQNLLRISFPEVRIIPEWFHHHFKSPEKISINLNPCWYNDKFLGLSICCCSDGGEIGADYFETTMICKSDPENRYSLKLYRNDLRFWSYNPIPFVMCFIYIPFKTLWQASRYTGIVPNDYCIFEVSKVVGANNEALKWGIRLVYESDA